ncbi:MAG: DUF3109 family protein [Ignavibacteriales bacterium]|nr:DUF3109 family protein [Ignavibacteriales bacterium]
MFVIQEIEVRPEIALSAFACDVTACKGTCCTMSGDRGAPLLDEELKEIEAALPVVKKYLHRDHLQEIERYGAYEGSDGDWATRCIAHRACVFVVYEGSIAQCAFETAFFNKEISWQKPLSCHLFPIRIDRGNSERLRYEYISECQPALQRGTRQKTWLSDFLKDALIRAYGKAWYEEFQRRCENERSA